jgi:hypothetical protein
MNCEVDNFGLEIQFSLRVKEFFNYNFEKLQKFFLMTPNTQCTNKIEGVRIDFVALNHQYGR